MIKRFIVILLLGIICNVSNADKVHLGSDSVQVDSSTQTHGGAMMSHGTTGATAGTADSFCVCIVSGEGSGLIGAIYEDDGDAPGNLLCVSDSLQENETGWNQMLFSTACTLQANTKYWFGYLSDSGRGTYFDDGSAGDAQFKDMSYPTFDNPFDTPDGTNPRIISQYVVYTEIGGEGEKKVKLRK